MNEENNHCCTRLELNSMLNEAMVAFNKNQDIHESLLHAMENIYTKRDGYSSSKINHQLLQCPNSTSWIQQHQIQSSSSTTTTTTTQRTFRDIVHGPIWPKIGQGLDMSIEICQDGIQEM